MNVTTTKPIIRARTSAGITALLILLAATFIPTHAQACRVLDPELQGRYDGPCNRHGLADGTGEAWGVAHYKGKFVDGMKQGIGIKDWPATGDRYAGHFMADFREGWGRYEWGVKSPWQGQSYEGMYRHDERDGEGVYFLPNGDKFLGYWKHDQALGQGYMDARGDAARRYADKAFGKVGAEVCREATRWSGEQVLLVGRITAVDKDRWQITLDPTSAAANITSGAVVEAELADMLDWSRCQPTTAAPLR